jgi:short-subunit dehydrogenase
MLEIDTKLLQFVYRCPLATLYLVGLEGTRSQRMTEAPNHIVITGASSGIGEALAAAYASPGTRLALTGRDQARLEAVADLCRNKGAEVEAARLDVTEAQAMAEWFERQHDARPLDLVIANAGVAIPIGYGPGRAERARHTLAVNVTGVINTVEPAIALMAARGHGQIAIMSSLAGFRGLPSVPVYSASKAAVKAYGEALRVSFAPKGIAVSVICPGFVKSRITDSNDFPMPFLMDAARAAAIIKHGLARNRARIAFPFRLYAAVWLLAGLPPALVDRLLARMPEKGG